MILLPIAFAILGLYLLIMGDGPAKLVGVILILVAAVFIFLFWVAIYVELPPVDAYLPALEVHHV
jgi:cation transporter-like permease